MPDSDDRPLLANDPNDQLGPLLSSSQRTKSPTSTPTPPTFMSSLDVDRSVSRRGSFPSASSSLTHAYIQDALLSSPDEGATLAFTKKGLTDIGEAAAEELATIGMEPPEDESRVRRIALNHNRLTTIPMEFALLARLRYLNLKNNCFSVFPDALTLMPSLDTLDISNNKIKRLPSQPGNLVNLRVFCLSRNKLTRLPTYLVKFHKLTVLEVERNPIEWPPKSVMERRGPVNSAEAMSSWIHNIQRWIDMECSGGRKGHDDSGFGEMESKTEDNYVSWARLPLTDREFDEGVTPHARSFSIDSNFSVSSLAESVNMNTPASNFDSPDRPPPLHLGILQSYSTETSPTHSLESYLPSPAESDTFPDSNISTEAGRDDDFHQRQQQLHGRNASYAGDAQKGRRAPVSTDRKKSLPDLRTAKLNFSKKTPDLPDRRPAALSRANFTEEYSMPSPQSQRQDSGSSLSSGSRHINKVFGKDYVRTSPTRAVPSMAFERNSYFRRLSTLPLNASNNIPKPLLDLIDTARSILFAVCQIYQTLEHYTLQALDDRLSSVLKKVLHPASADMMQFINSLDRFDAMSRKMVPSPPVCRAVVESCRDTVAVFGKAVGVLALQLKVIVNADDVRYLRQLVLNLYGATAEITLAWQSMLPQIEAAKTLLHSKGFTTSSPPGGFGLLAGNTESQPASASAASTPGSSLDSPIPPFISLRPQPGRTHQARRHAGSFSFKDVEIGKALPSYDDVPLPVLSRSLATSSTKHTLRAPKRQGTLTPASLTVQSPSPTSPYVTGSTSTSVVDSSRSNHSRSGSQASLQASSTSSSPIIPAPKATFLELPSTSKIQVDKEAIQAVQDAVDVAPSVWDMVEEALSGVLDTKPEVRDSLDRARSVTKSLSDMMRAIKEGQVTADKKVLREEAHMFLKHVVQLSNAVKIYGGAVSSTLRTSMVKLTNSTEEFAILLHVSSFSPSPASSSARPYSPMLGLPNPQSHLNLPEERLSPGLSRSRSAQAATTSTKLPISPIPDGSKSALPHQSFKVPVIKRFRDREPRFDGNDPG
uniref:Leucine-rich repeat-containing protein sog2 n=2 Tax=Moniliophthora roreri TaxID=221103 RepID=A0A0W0F3S4_MONRR